MKSVREPILQGRKVARVAWGLARVLALTLGLSGTAPRYAEALVTADATSSVTDNGNTITVSHTTGSGASRLMLVGVSLWQSGNSGRVVTSVAYGAQGLTFVGASDDPDNQARIEIWRLLAPATGTANVVVTLTQASATVMVGVMTFDGVNQSTPLGAFAGADATSGTPTVDVSSAVDELVFDVIGSDESIGQVLSVGAGQTERWNYSGSEISGGGSTEPGAATVTMSWSRSDPRGAMGDWRRLGRAGGGDHGVGDQRTHHRGGRHRDVHDRA